MQHDERDEQKNENTKKPETLPESKKPTTEWREAKHRKRNYSKITTPIGSVSYGPGILYANTQICPTNKIEIPKVSDQRTTVTNTPR